MVPSFPPQADRQAISGACLLIKSKVKNFYYKDFCKNLQKRLNEHNSGMTKSNKAYKPFDLIYFEKSLTKEEVIKKEKYWKSATGRRYLKNKMLS